MRSCSAPLTRTLPGRCQPDTGRQTVAIHRLRGSGILHAANLIPSSSAADMHSRPHKVTAHVAYKLFCLEPSSQESR